MNTAIKVLILEDRPSDAELMVSELRQSGYDVTWRCVDTAKDYLANLDTRIDLILADYSLPQYTALQALHTLHEFHLDIPFIVVTGSISEEAAVECMKQGAADYLLKDRLTRLGSAVAGALEQRLLKAEKQASEERYRRVLESIPAVTYVSPLTEINTAEYISPQITDILWFSLDEWVAIPDLWEKQLHPEDKERVITDRLKCSKIGDQFKSEYRMIRKDGKVIWVSDQAQVIQENSARHPALRGFMQDITQRKAAEELDLAHYNELQGLLSLSTRLRSALELDEIVPILLEEVQGLLHADAAFVALQNSKNPHFTITRASGHLKRNTGKKFHNGEGIFSLVLRSLQPYVTTDYASDPHRLSGLGHGKWIGPAAFVPIQSEIGLLGVLAVTRHRSETAIPFTPSELNLLATIGEMSGNTLRRASLFSDAMRRLRQMQALNVIYMAITGSSDLKISLPIILEQVMPQLGIDAAAVLIPNPLTNLLEFSAGIGFRSATLQHTRLRLGDGYAGRAALEQRTIYIPDLRNRKTDFLRPVSFATEDFIAYITTPLVSKGQVLGVLELFTRRHFSPDEEWMDFLNVLAGQAAIAIGYAQLFLDLQSSNDELGRAYDATIEGWSRAMDLRDKETEGHTKRVTDIAVHLARKLEVAETEITHIRRGALLHDIGKMGVPDHILLKPGALSDEEWVIMKKHPVFAREMLTPIDYLQQAIVIPYFHHEKWDGTGYPQGLAGEQIPIAARIFAIVDVWDALCSDRPYRAGWPKEKALQYIHEQSGKHFDPRIVGAFLNMMKERQLEPVHVIASSI